MRLHSGTGDAELAADAGERLIRGKERQDACLGWRQADSLAGPVLGGRLRLAGDGAVTLRRGRSICHRPIWLISPCLRRLARTDPVTGALGVRELRPEAVVVACDSWIDSSRSLQQRSPATDGRSDRGWGAIAPHPYGPVSAADFAAFPTGSMGVFTDPTFIWPNYRLGCPFLGSEKWHHLMPRTAFAERWVMGPGSRKEVTDLSEILIALSPCGECGDGHTRVRG